MELKPIDRTDRAVGRLNAALSIYRETILAEAQNPERQILYWIEHSKDALADEFRCFAILHDKAVIGYLQYSYFREEHVYKSVDDAKAAIDRYFNERNAHFRDHPRRAGATVWGKEPGPARFSEFNNCKDPRFR